MVSRALGFVILVVGLVVVTVFKSTLSRLFLAGLVSMIFLFGVVAVVVGLFVLGSKGPRNRAVVSRS